MKSPKEDYNIRKSVALDSGPREDLLIFLSFYTLVIYHVFTSRSNKCTSKVVTPNNKQTQPPGWKQLKLLFHEFTLYSYYNPLATSGANKLNLSYSWS